jgi:amidohydrolase
MDKHKTHSLSDLRKRLHQYPEISGNEKLTAKIISEALRPLSPHRVIESLGGHGVAFGWKGPSKGPVVVFRAELDALPIDDLIENEWKSKHPGVGHKCGHDGHMAILVGLAHALASKVQQGELWCLFQPAEETGEGARAVLSSESWQTIKPTALVAMHNLPGVPLHQVVLREGTFSNASQGLIIRLEGKTSHASEPWNGISPAPFLARLLEIIPLVPTKLFGAQDLSLVTPVHAVLGTPSFGISPGHATLYCTLRAMSDEKLQQLVWEVQAMVNDMAPMYKVNVSFEKQEHFGATVNQADLVQKTKSAALEADLSVIEKEEPFGWSEDFGLFTQQYPGVMIGLGAGVACPALHHPTYDFPDELIPTGIRLMEGIYHQILSTS